MPASTACSCAVELNWTDRLFTGTARTKVQEPTLGKPEVRVLLSQFPLADALLQRRFPEGSRSLTFGIETVLGSLESVGVRIPAPHEIHRYLMAHHDLVDLVSLAVGAALKRFRDKAELSLELYRDPEIDDEYLTIYVRQDSYDDKVMDTIKEVWREYQSDLADKSGWLLVTTDFGPPS